MDTVDADKEVITRYVKGFIKHGDPAELVNYLLAEARHDQGQARHRGRNPCSVSVVPRLALS